MERNPVPEPFGKHAHTRLMRSLLGALTLVAACSPADAGDGTEVEIAVNKLRFCQN